MKAKTYLNAKPYHEKVWLVGLRMFSIQIFSKKSGRRNTRLVSRRAIKCALLASAIPKATSSNHLQDEGAQGRSQYERVWRQSTRRLPT
jgi:hypothetical protein